MKRAFFANEKNGVILLFSLIIFLGSIAVFFAVAAIIAIPLFHVSLTELLQKLQDGTNPENINILKYFQILQSIGIFIIPSLFIGFLVSRKPFEYLRFKCNFNPQLILLAVFTVILASPFINLLAYINQQMAFPDILSRIENWMKMKETEAEEITIAFLNVTSLKDLLINILMIGLLPAIGEEMAFRGVIQNQLIKITGSRNSGVIVTAFLFSAVHMQFYGLLPRFVLGLILGYMFIWTSNIWYPIIFHFINNTAAVLAYYYINVSGINFDIENIGATTNTYYLGIISGLITFGLIFAFYRISFNQRQQ